MNYFAHGRHFIDDPYFLAGTAVPDWLNVVDRKVRVRSKSAQPFCDDANSEVAALAQGVVRHHRDDGWFHATRAFGELSLEFTVAIRDRLPRDDGMRPSFLGHILVELLLDAALIADDPRRLDEYYEALGRIEPLATEQAVNLMATRPTNGLRVLLPRFQHEKFLYDYADDAKLLWRLNQVMRRVKLQPLPDSLAEFFPTARDAVAQRKAELLAEEDFS